MAPLKMDENEKKNQFLALPLEEAFYSSPKNKYISKPNLLAKSRNELKKKSLEKK